MGKHNLRLILAVLVLIGIVGWIVPSKNYLTPEELLNKSSNSTGQACQVIYKQDKAVEIEGKIIQAEVADDASEKATGLGGRDCIGHNQGMLFMFDKPGQYGFWMKDMEFPIDIIWIDVNHHVVKVQANVEEDTYPTVFTNDQPAQYVLELPAGRADELGVNQNSIIQF